jgi:hypothetical protein
MARDRSAVLAAAAFLALGTAAGCAACSKGSAKPASRHLAAPAPSPAPPTAADLKARLLTPADLPAGFVADDDTSDTEGVMSSTEPDCRNLTDLMNSQGHPPGALAAADASFTRSQFGPTVATGLAGFATPEAAQKLLASVTEAMRDCTKLTETDKDGSTYDYLVAPLSVPPAGDASAAIRVSADVEGVSAQVDLVLVRVGDTLLYVADTDFGGSDPELTEQVVTRAVAKVRDPAVTPRSAPQPATTSSSVPAGVVKTAAGRLAGDQDPGLTRQSVA